MSEFMPITMESETMSALKADMDSILSKTISSMQATQNGEATVTVKIKITLERRRIADEQSSRAITVPKFEHDVQSVVQMKDKKSGSMPGEYELVYDPITDSWYMREIRAQISMFDKEAQRGDAPMATDENGNQVLIAGDVDVVDPDGDDQALLGPASEEDDVDPDDDTEDDSDAVTDDDEEALAQ